MTVHVLLYDFLWFLSSVREDDDEKDDVKQDSLNKTNYSEKESSNNTTTEDSPTRNCRVSTLIGFGGPEVVIHAKKKIHAYLLSVQRPSGTRFKKYTLIGIPPILGGFS